MNSFNLELKKRAVILENSLDMLIPLKDCPETEIYKAMRYSLLGGGKRLRGFLALVFCGIFSGREKKALSYACALEMIHAYSLIHDDLPAMDNDDLRRGKPTNHKVFGEATAILAGDGLLNTAFEIVLNDAALTEKEKITALKILSFASGTGGMIGGQVVDMQNEGKVMDKPLLTYMHRLKTGSLIKAAALGGAAIGKASDDSLLKVSEYADLIGLLFQITDDILDVEGTQEELGKPINSDVKSNKSTFVSFMGLDTAKNEVNLLTEKALAAAKDISVKAQILSDIVRYISNRKT